MLIILLTRNKLSIRIISHNKMQVIFTLCTKDLFTRSKIENPNALFLFR